MAIPSLDPQDLRIHGAKIVLRDWIDEDLDLWSYWMGAGHRWKELDAPYYSGPTQEEVDETTNRIRARFGKPKPVPPHRMVIATASANEFIGTVSWYWESEETCWPGLGIVIYDPRNWRKGFGREALGYWTSFLFATLPCTSRLDLRTWSGNEGMIVLAKSLGYQEEARFRRARIVNGTHFDALGFGVLREEWESGAGLRFPVPGYLRKAVITPIPR